MDPNERWTHDKLKKKKENDKKKAKKDEGEQTKRESVKRERKRGNKNIFCFSLRSTKIGP